MILAKLDLNSGALDSTFNATDAVDQNFNAMVPVSKKDFFSDKIFRNFLNSRLYYLK